MNWIKTMFAKKLELLGSLRFWMITIAAASQVVKIYFPELEALFNIISTWLAAVAGVGTVDKWSKAIKESK